MTLMSVLDDSMFLYKQRYKYCLTAKLNQDPLERHFGIMRYISGDIHPSTSPFLHLHMLQSIYVPVKTFLSKNLNVSADVDVPMEKF